MKNAFTIGEAVVGMMIAALTIILLTGVIKSHDRLANLNLSEADDWYLMIRDLESDKYQFTNPKVGFTFTDVSLYSQQEHCTYIVKQSGHTVFLSKDGEGYIPLFTTTKDGMVNFEQINSQQVRVIVKGPYTNEAILTFAKTDR